MSKPFEGQWVTCDGRKDPHLYDPTVCLGEIRPAEPMSTDSNASLPDWPAANPGNTGDLLRELRNEVNRLKFAPPVLTELSPDEGKKKIEKASNHEAVQDAATGDL
jgi:hypothetical protein